MRLEGGLAILVIAKVVEQFLHGLSEAVVLCVGIKLLAKKLEFVKNAVGVIAVALLEKKIAFVGQLVPFFSGTVLHNEARLLQAFADVGVDGLEPILELGVLISITVDGVDGVNQVIGRCGIGKALE